MPLCAIIDHFMYRITLKNTFTLILREKHRLKITKKIIFILVE